MAKKVKKKKTNLAEVKSINGLIFQSQKALHDIIYENIKEYSDYVLEDRALPSWQDGLTPARRRLLWALYHVLGSRPEKHYIKAARVTGAAMQFHPHSGAYGVLVNMIEGAPAPLVTGLGNWGSYVDGPAAERYTEVKASAFTIATFFDPRFTGCMQTVPSYDGSSYEPVYLPSQIPIVLATGTAGIAVGLTTDIPAFTVASLLKAVQLALDSKDYIVSTKKLINTLEFSSAYGGKIDESLSEIKSVMETGVGVISWECDYEVIKDEVHIYGFPPGWFYTTKINAIQKIPDVSAVVNLSHGTKIHIKVTFRQVDKEKKEEAIRKVINLLKSKKHHKMNVTTRYYQKDDVVDFSRAEFEQLSVQSLLARWTAHRIELEKQALTYEQNNLVKDLARLELLKLASDNLDIIFKILKTKNIDKVVELSKKLKITKEDSSYIWSLAVGRLDRLNSEDVSKQIKTTKEKIKTVKFRYKNPEKSVSQHIKENIKTLSSPVAYDPTA